MDNLRRIAAACRRHAVVVVDMLAVVALDKLGAPAAAEGVADEDGVVAAAQDAEMDEEQPWESLRTWMGVSYDAIIDVVI